MIASTSGALRSGAALAAVLLLAPVLPARALDENTLQERPPERSVAEESASIERGLEEEEEAQPPRVEGVKDWLEDLPPFLRDTSLEVDFRSQYFRRRLTTGGDQEALAIGGVVRYQSGWLLEHAKIGAALFTSQKALGPNDRDGTGLLRPRQRSFTTLGEGFLKLRALGHELTGGRQLLDFPYLNGNDSRMTPNSFEGVTLFGRTRFGSYGGGHLFRIKTRNEQTFDSFSQVAGVPGASSNGMSFGGFGLEPIPGLSVGAVDYYVKDTLNTAYFEVEWAGQDEEGSGLRLGSQFTDQRSVGDDRLTGESFETWVWGAKLSGSWREVVITAAVSVTSDDQAIRNPFGSYPGYLGMMFRNFNRAGQRSWGIGASGYLTTFGLPELSLALRYSEGYEGRDVQRRKIGTEREFNATLDYQLARGVLRGLWIRGRFGWGKASDEPRDSLEARVLLRYQLQVL